MPQKTNLNISPYYDDFSENNSFYRILFKPSYAVQARELNQLQTILQNQVEKFGGHIFQDGSPVVGGELVYNNKVKSLKLETQNEAGNDVYAFNFNKRTIIGTTSGARALVVFVNSQAIIDPVTLIIEPLNGIDFIDGETIRTEVLNEDDTYYTAILTSAAGLSGISGAQSDSSLVSINNGYYFVNGFFLFVGKQDLILDKYTNTPTYRVGLTVTETLPDYADDNNLLDNAQGSLNYAAPGADRLKIQLILSKKLIEGDDVESNSDINFIELLRLRNGIEIKSVRYPVYSELEKTLARRTYDESGDYTVRPFGLQIVEHNPQDGTTPDTNNKFSVGLEPGKAYVKGFEFENISTEYLDIDKGKDTLNVSSYVISSGYGNRIITKNAEGFWNLKTTEMVDLHCVTKSQLDLKIHEYNILSGSLRTQAEAERIYSATKIGTARIRNFDWYTESNSANTTHFHSKYETFLYDVRMSTSDVLNPEATSDGETNFIYLQQDKSTDLDDAYNGMRITISTDGTTDTVTILDYQGSNRKATLSTSLSTPINTNTRYIINYDFKDVESLVTLHAQDPANAQDQRTSLTTGATFPETDALLYLSSSMDIDDTSKYNSDPLQDTILKDTDRNTLLFELPNAPIAGVTGKIDFDTKVYFRARNVASGGLVDQFSAPTGYSFKEAGTANLGNRANEYFTVIVTENGGSVISPNPDGEILTAGQILDFSTESGRTIGYSGGLVQINCNTSSGSLLVDVIATVESSVNGDDCTKSLIVGKVDSTTGLTSIPDGQIVIKQPNKTPLGKDTLMISDVLRLVKVIDSRDELFSVNDTILEGVMTGDSNYTVNDVTDNYTLDNGQRDNYYDHASIQLKVGATPPVGQLLIIVDHFEYDGTGGVFTVNSYVDIFGTTFNNDTETFSYDTIPSFTSSRSGKTYQLRDCLDFRPIRKNINNEEGDNTDNFLINEGPEILNPGTYTTAFTEDDIFLPDPDGVIRLDYSHYLGRIDKILITRDKEFKILRGVSSLNPLSPSDDEDSMTLYIIKIPPYTFSLNDIETKYIDNKRYTMRDIGKLEKRIEQLEYYATLSMLERETVATTVTSEESIDTVFNPIGEKFKSGILVDSFSGHSVGDVQLEEYICSIDYDKKLLRPSFISNCYKFNVGSIGTDSINIQKSGDLVTLPYTEENYITQPLASFSEQINPFGIKNYNGKIKSYPDSSIFFDQDVTTKVLVNLEGQYDNWAYSSNQTKGFGTHWNDWSELWTGKFVNTDPELGIISTASSLRQTKLVGEVSTRFGIKTNKTPESIFRSVGNKIVNVSIIPFMYPETIYFSAKGVKPETDMWLFFGEKNMASYAAVADNVLLENVTGEFIDGEEVETNISGQTTILGTANILTYVKTGDATCYLDVRMDSSGTLNSIFPAAQSCRVVGKVSGAIGFVSDNTEGSTSITKFKSSLYGTVSGRFAIQESQHYTGEKLLRLIDTSDGKVENCTTVAEKIYHSVGTYQTREKLLISTRPPLVKRPNINAKNIVQSVVGENLTSEFLLQPLSQTFFVDVTQNPEGIFINDVTLFFQSKPDITGDYGSSNPPVTLQIRPVFDSFPSPSLIVPFSEVVRDIRSINVVSELVDPNNSEHATVFSFEAPVYLAPGEYAIVIQTNSIDYSVWAGESGKKHQDTNNNITKQPNVGSLFRMQKSGVWNRSEIDSIMFKINMCKFSTNSVGYVNLKNTSLKVDGSNGVTNFNTFKVFGSLLNFNSGSITTGYRYTNSDDTLVFEKGFSLDQNIILDELGKITASDGSFTVNVVMTTSNENISPVIDLTRTGLIAIENVIDDGRLSSSDFVIVNGGENWKTDTTQAVITGGGAQGGDPELNAGIVLSFDEENSNTINGITVTQAGKGYITTPEVSIVDTSGQGSGANILISGETSADKGNLKVRYITRRVNLKDGFDASDLRVFLTAYRPQGTNIYVYYKVLSASDPNLFDDCKYQLMSQFTTEGTYSINEDDYVEYEYRTVNDTASYVGLDDSYYDTYKTFAIKICMTSDDTIESKIPKIRDLRAIALID